MRIIAGTAGGRLLATLKDRRTRPTADRVKEAIFSSLALRLPDARVLDAFAGTAALGLEAMSRGAQSAVFIEKDRQAALICAKNIAQMQLRNCRLLRGDCLKLLVHWQGGPFDIIFADPPYHSGLLLALMNVVATANLLAAGGILVAETAARESELPADPHWRLLRTSVYGDTAVQYLEQN